MKNYKIISLQNNLITNFNPNFLNFFKKTDLIKTSKKDIFCKNFLIYILLIKYNKKFNLSINTKIHIKKQKNKVYTIIRSPYRHKLARHQISFNRFFLKIIFDIHIKSIIIVKNFKNILKFLKIIKSLNILFETNIISLENIKLNFSFKFKNNFIINNFF